MLPMLAAVRPRWAPVSAPGDQPVSISTPAFSALRRRCRSPNSRVGVPPPLVSESKSFTDCVIPGITPNMLGIEHMDAAYANALQARARLRRDLEKVEEFIAMYDRFAASSPENASAETWDQKANINPVTAPGADAAQAALGLNPPDSRKRVSGNPKPAEVIRAVKDLLTARGHPMTRRQLLAALDEAGLKIRGANPLKVLGTNLWRAHDDIVSLDGHGYWLKNKFYGPANYHGDL